MKTAKKLVDRLQNMSIPTYIFLKACLILSCALLLAALITLCAAGDFSSETYRLHNLARELRTSPQGVLLIAAIGSVCIEERTMK